MRRLKQREAIPREGVRADHHIAADRSASNRLARQQEPVTPRFMRSRTKQSSSCRLTWGTSSQLSPASTSVCIFKIPAGTSSPREHLPPSHQSKAASSYAESTKPRPLRQSENVPSLSVKGAAIHFKLCLQRAVCIPERGTCRGDRDCAGNCTPLPCRGATAPRASKGFGFVLTQNGRCCSETGAKSPHEAFLKTSGS